MKKKAIPYKTKVSNNQKNAGIVQNRRTENEALLANSLLELKKIYWYEKELLVVIPMLLSNAHTFELVDSLCVLYHYTTNHISPLEENFPHINQLESSITPYATLPLKKIV